MGWLIALGIAALIVSFFFLRVFAVIGFDDGITVSIKVLFIKIKVFPMRPKKKKYRPEKEKTAKAEKKKKKKEEKKKQKASAEAKKEKKKKKLSFSEIIDLIKTVTDISKKLLSLFVGYIAVRVNKLYIVIDGGDPSKTALEYAGAVAAVNSLFALLDENVNVRYGRDENINVVPGFNMCGSSFEIDIAFGFRIWQLIRMGVSAALAYLKIKTKTEGANNERQQNERDHKDIA